MLPSPTEDEARQLTNFEKRLSHLERLERGGWILIDSQDLTIAGTITFSNIPNTYTHLKMIGYLRDTTVPLNVDVRMRFNGDAGANYDYYREFETGTGVRARNTQIATNLIQVANIPGSTTPANTFGSLECLIAHYSNINNHKVCQAYSITKSANAAANLAQIYVAGWWRNIAAITTINLLETFAIGSRVDLYGVA